MGTEFQAVQLGEAVIGLGVVAGFGSHDSQNKRSRQQRGELGAEAGFLPGRLPRRISFSRPPAGEHWRIGAASSNPMTTEGMGGHAPAATAGLGISGQCSSVWRR